MFKNSSLTLVLLLLAAGVATAATTAPQTTAAVPPATAASPETANPHKQYDQKIRTCKQEAALQNLVGEAQRAFVVACVRKP